MTATTSPRLRAGSSACACRVWAALWRRADVGPCPRWTMKTGAGRATRGPEGRGSGPAGPCAEVPSQARRTRAARFGRGRSGPIRRLRRAGRQHLQPGTVSTPPYLAAFDPGGRGRVAAAQDGHALAARVIGAPGHPARRLMHSSPAAGVGLDCSGSVGAADRPRIAVSGAISIVAPTSASAHDQRGQHPVVSSVLALRRRVATKQARKRRPLPAQTRRSRRHVRISGTAPEPRAERADGSPSPHRPDAPTIAPQMLPPDRPAGGRGHRGHPTMRGRHRTAPASTGPSSANLAHGRRPPGPDADRGSWGVISSESACRRG